MDMPLLWLLSDYSTRNEIVEHNVDFPFRRKSLKLKGLRIMKHCNCSYMYFMQAQHYKQLGIYTNTASFWRCYMMETNTVILPTVVGRKNTVLLSIQTHIVGFLAQC